LQYSILNPKMQGERVLSNNAFPIKKVTLGATTD
jgi:hypothetical protein